MMRRLPTLLFVVLLSSFAFGQKKVLDASVYDSWRNVRNVALSNDGKWLVYGLVPQEGDALVEVKSTDGTKTYTIERGSGMQFSEDGKFLVATIVPKNEETKKARRAKAKPEDMPKNSLVILNLELGQRVDLDKITSFSLAPHDQGWLIYKPEPPKPAAAAPKPEAAKPEAAKPEEKKPEEKKKDGPKADHKPGDTWVLRNLSTGKEEKIENVVSTRWSKDGSLLVYTVSTQDGSGDGVVAYDVKAGSKKQIVTGLGKYPKIAVSDATHDIAFVTDKDDYQAKKPALSVYLAHDGKLTKLNTATLNAGFVPAEGGSLQFSDKGTRLTFAVASKPEEEKKDDTPDDEKVSVDIWNWQDAQMMPQQLMQAAAERSRTYDAIFDLNTGVVAQLESPHLRNVTVSAKGDGPTALGSTNEPYARASTWGDGKTDYYTVDLQTGKATPLLTGFDGLLMLSPGGKYAYGYESGTKELFSIDLKSGKRTLLNKGLPAIWDEEDDHPDNPAPYGMGGWLAKDAGFVVYDRYDAWLVDPSGANKSVNLTQGAGRSGGIRLRIRNFDPEADFLDLSKPVVLTAFNDSSKAAGFYRLTGGRVEKLVMQDKTFSSAIKARSADVYALQRMDFNEPADVWLAHGDLGDMRKVSDVNPQQKDYNWMSAELVTWTSNDGQQLQGVLYKPENFDPAKKYPMITYYYERDSDTLHQYFSPAPSASTINIPMYCSQGYIVFDPDIPYKVGYPGESALSAILPGVQTILARGYVDPKKLGLQGQSWGGYETGYLVTETNMFAAACAGAPVSNMISAYGGIRWESGVSREGQYEHGQSRIGGTLWEQPLRFIENSPIFFVDKIKTPLLIMSNDKDGAVPWYQGIEYFSALRRLNKPAWLVCYNDEQHNLMQRKNRKDWSIRMQQFFDHYLKGAPMPVWMAQGVPATQKGKTYGFELVPSPDVKKGQAGAPNGG